MTFVLLAVSTMVIFRDKLKRVTSISKFIFFFDYTFVGFLTFCEPFFLAV